MRVGKVKASALQFAILVATMVALFLGAFLTLTHTHRFFADQSQFLMQSVEGANQGVGYSLQPDAGIRDSITFQEELLTTTVAKSYWGGFEMIRSRATVRTKSFSKKALTGSALGSQPTSIYMGDDRFPLVLVGNTKIEGTAYISSKGIKPGSIAGHYYTGGNLIDGPIRYSSGSLPRLDAQWSRTIKQWMDFIPGTEHLVVPQQPVQNSFYEDRMYIYDEGPVTISETYLGNIVIISKTEITVTPEARLQDILVVAPKITLQKGTQGSAHFIANEQIKVEEDVVLSYPSSLVVMYEQPDDNRPVPRGDEPVVVSDFAEVNGNVILQFKKDTLAGSRTHMAFAEEARIRGMVYCQGNIEHKGTIEGSVYTNTFLANESGSVYLNHLYKGKVLANRLHPEYCGLPFQNKQKGIAKWLY